MEDQDDPVRSLFQRIDVSEVGRITRDDYRRFLRSLDPDAEVSEDAVDELFGVMPTHDDAILYQDFIANYHQLLAEDEVDNDPGLRGQLKRRLSCAVMTPTMPRRNSFLFSATSPDENERLEELRDQLGEDRFDRFTRMFDRYNQDGRGIAIEEEFINMIQNEDDTLQTRDRIQSHWAKKESDGVHLERLAAITFLELFVDDPDPISGPPSATSSVHNTPAYSSMGNGHQHVPGGHLSSFSSDIVAPSPARPTSFRGSSRSTATSVAPSAAPSIAPSLAPSAQSTMSRHKRGSSLWSMSRAASPPVGDFPSYSKRHSASYWKRPSVFMRSDSLSPSVISSVCESVSMRDRDVFVRDRAEAPRMSVVSQISLVHPRSLRRYTSVIDNDITVPSSMHRASGPENFSTSDLRAMSEEELQTLVMDFSSELRLVYEQFKSSELQNQKFVEQLTRLKSDGIRKALEFEDLKKTLFDKNSTLSTLRTQIEDQKDGLEAHRSVIENLHADQQELLKKSKNLADEAVEARERVERFQGRESDYLQQIKSLSSRFEELQKLRNADALALSSPHRKESHIAMLEAEVTRLNEVQKAHVALQSQSKELMNECADLRRLLGSHTPNKFESPHFTGMKLPAVPLMEQIDLQRSTAAGEKLSSLNELFEIQQKQQKRLEEEHLRSKIESERLEDIQRCRAKELEEERIQAKQESKRLEELRQERSKKLQEEQQRTKQETERLEQLRKERATKFEEEQRQAELESRRLKELQRDRAQKLEEEQRQAQLQGAKFDELRKQRSETLKREKHQARVETERLEQLRKQRLAKYEEEQRAAKLESERLEEIQRQRAAKLEEEQQKALEESERMEQLQRQRAEKLDEEIQAEAELKRLEQLQKERAKKLEAEHQKAREEGERLKALRAQRAAQFEDEQNKAKIEMERLAKLQQQHSTKLKEEQKKADKESQRLQEFQRQNSEELNEERAKAQIQHARLEAEKAKDIEELRHKEEMMRTAREKQELEDKIAKMIDEQKRLQRQKSLELLTKEREEQKLETELEISNELSSLRACKENAFLKEQYFKLIYRVLQFRVENEMRHIMRIEAATMAADMDLQDECHSLTRMSAKHQRSESFDSVRELTTSDNGDPVPKVLSFDDDNAVGLKHDPIAFYEQF